MELQSAVMEGDDQTFKANFSSEGVSRLRGVVEEKLKEFMGDYTDETLVEYVIVLLKNGRSKDEAKNELDVFLGDDSDSFISWLWDHLGSNLSVYAQAQELQPGFPKTEPSAGDQPGNAGSDQMESEADKGNYVETYGHHKNRENKGHLRGGDEAPLPRSEMKSVAKNVNIRDEDQPSDSQSKPHRVLRSTIHKKRRRNDEEQHQRKGSRTLFGFAVLHFMALEDSYKVVFEDSATTTQCPGGFEVVVMDVSPAYLKSLWCFSLHLFVASNWQREVSQSTVSAPKRLLQFAVRDAVATSRPPNATAEPSVKRLRSVVSTTESYAEARPQRIRHASMSVAIKAMAEAVKDVAKVRPSRNVFDRLGNAMNGPNTSSHCQYGGVTEDAVDGDFNVEMESLHSSYYPRDDISVLQEGNMPSFHEEVMDIARGYDRENYDERGREGTDIYPSGSSSGKWVESSLKFQYGAADHVDGTAYRPRKDIIRPAAVHSAIPTDSSSVSMKMRKPQYQEEIEAAEMDDHERMRGADAVSTNSEVWLMKTNNNHTVPFNGNAKPDATLHESERSQGPSGLRNTGPPAEDADSCTIFVSNVHFAATKDSLSRHFNKFGEVLKVIILTDPATGQPKGSAYIEFMSKEAAELALSLDGTSFLSRILKIVKKTSAQPDVASAMTWPRVARASPFVVPRYDRAPFARGMQYRGGRVPMMLPGARSFQWKRGSDSTVPETLGQASNSMILSPTTRSLTYVRAETKTNVSSG
ncbi:hypothetical protein SASPL_137441 [Salvia splendens]|uniref:RRM domain-containing protein n=1 Tax=Salvia splendens TaxID=180675 RepID=A0A8X8WTB5_SALSN|nr:hypothetical protein SASPL_137441 [Salvia splendens]